MLTLLKYEFKKNIKDILGLGLFFLLALLIVFYNIYTANNATIIVVLQIIILTGLTIGHYLFIPLVSISHLFTDLNTNTGYCLFMTPNSNYSIIGSKILIIFFEFFIYDIFLTFILYLLADTSIPIANGEFFVDAMPKGIEWILINITTYVNGFLTITLICFSIIFGRFILNHLKSKWIISLLIFVLIRGLLLLLNSFVNVDSFLTPTFIYTTLLNLFTGIIFYLLTCHILNKKICI